ncbi:MAG: hypothetical protein JJ892_01255 [Balneola sp.]|nr:hypothetical protein [Balneola sp.]MBO6869988.1 hypothetical protein [Balneola sp.]
MNFSKSIYPILINNWIKMCSIVQEFELKSKNFPEACSKVWEVTYGTSGIYLIKVKAENSSQSFTDIQKVTLIK